MECNGLAGDTIHMARMFDASRLQGGGSGYSLEALSSDAEIMKRFGKVESKTSMKKLFEQPVIKKDGTAVRDCSPSALCPMTPPPPRPGAHSSPVAPVISGRHRMTNAMPPCRAS